MNVTQRKTCRLCGSDKLGMVLPLTPTALCDAYVHIDRIHEQQEIYPLDLFLCGSCGYVFLPYVVDPEIIYRDYIYVTTSSMGLSEHFQHNADKVLNKTHPSPESLIIDIGSNDGTLLQHFKKRNMRVLGIEPATEIARRATEAGVETLPVFFTSDLSVKIRRDHGPAAIVTMNNLFANIDDLKDVTIGVRNLLAADGVFVVESSYLADMVRNMVFDFIYHEHLSYFSVTPLQAFFQRLDMELFDVERIATKGGSLRYYIQLKGGTRPVSAAVSELVAEEDAKGLHHADIYKTFSDRIDARKNQVRDMLRDIKARGKSTAGYGGSATTTTLVYHFGIHEMMDYIVDDNPAKQHTFSPGYHIPVLPAQTLYELKPDYVVILAWRYAESIIRKHQAYLDQGGHFIIPLPDVKVI